jgi:hypothetical protein
MMSDKTVRGTHFNCFHAGPKEGWTEFRLEPPAVPVSVSGCSAVLPLRPVPCRQRDPGRHARRPEGRRPARLAELRGRLKEG